MDKPFTAEQDWAIYQRCCSIACSEAPASGGTLAFHTAGRSLGWAKAAKGLAAMGPAAAGCALAALALFAAASASWAARLIGPPSIRETAALGALKARSRFERCFDFFSKARFGFCMEAIGEHCYDQLALYWCRALLAPQLRHVKAPIIPPSIEAPSDAREALLEAFQSEYESGRFGASQWAKALMAHRLHEPDFKAIRHLASLHVGTWDYTPDGSPSLSDIHLAAAAAYEAESGNSRPLWDARAIDSIQQSVELGRAASASVPESRHGGRGGRL